MKVVIALYACVCLFFISAAGQSPKVPQHINTWYDFWGVLTDSIMGIPNVTPQARYRAPGLIWNDTGDSSMRLSTGTNNIKIGPAIQYPHYSIAQQASVNPAFIVDASAIVAIGNNYNLGDTIQWKILDSGFAHGANWYTSAYGDVAGNNLLVINPPSRMVMSGIITVDESFAAQGVQVGGSVAQSAIAAPIYQLVPIGVQLDAAGTTHWQKTGRNINSFVVDTFNVSNGVTLLDHAPSSNGWLFSAEGTNINYCGSNNYHVRRIFSGLGARSMGFQLCDNATNAVILTAPTSSDHITISSSCVGQSSFNTHTYDASNSFVSTSFNFWVRGLYEAWMVADQIDSGAINVKYQTNFTGATAYKIYRGTSPVFGSQTLIHTGTSGSFIDAGLAANTKYYYSEYATVSAVDVFVTTFICQTRNNY
jgi:hypothetical protein